MSDSVAPLLSVILIASQDYAHIQKTMRHLRAQTRAADIELVLLTGYGARLTAMLDSESVLHRDLNARGEKLFLETRASVAHLNTLRWAPFCAYNFWGRRILGGSRAKQNRPPLRPLS